MGQARAALNVNPPAALSHNSMAYAANPLSWEVRLNAPLTLGKVMAWAGKNPGVTLHVAPGAADRAHGWAMSASPHNPLVLMLRLQYLFAADRNHEEMELIAAELRRDHMARPEVRGLLKQYEELK